jgi:hypothetical protein
MLNAAIADCPVFGGKVKGYDTAKAMKVKGVKKVVPVGDSAVAVVADTWWHAKTGLEALAIQWDYGQYADASTRSSRKCSRPDSTPTRRSSAIRWATRARPSLQRRVGSRRCIATRIRTTRRWKR